MIRQKHTSLYPEEYLKYNYAIGFIMMCIILIVSVSDQFTGDLVQSGNDQRVIL